MYIEIGGVMSKKASSLGLPFGDWRKFGFVRVGAFSPVTKVADVQHNTGSHIDALYKLYQKGIMYAVGPELGVSGYTCGDLFGDDELLDAVLLAVHSFIDASDEFKDMIFSVGMPLKINSALYNCSVTFLNGRILKVTPKIYPPNYGEFYEVRHFASGEDIEDEPLILESYPTRFGTNIVIKLNAHPDAIIAEDICEDVWMVIPQSSLLALLGNATILGNLSASNITVGKSKARTALIEDAGRTIAARIYSAAGWGESTTDLAWDGDCMIGENGRILVRTNRFSKYTTICWADIDVQMLSHERKRQQTFRSHQAKIKRLMPGFKVSVIEVDEVLGAYNLPVYERLQGRVTSRTPFVPDEGPERDDRCFEVFHIQGTALATRLQHLKERFYAPKHGKDETYPYLFVGVSGGRDSTHVLSVCAWTLDYLGWPRSQLIGITMPGFGTTDETYEIAKELVPALGGELVDQSIVEHAQKHLVDVGYNLYGTDHTTAFENAQAWERMVKLMVHAAHVGGIVIGTGDLSELMIGWCTYLGDHGSHYNPNAGDPKTLLNFLIDWARNTIYRNDPVVIELMTRVLALEVSPELLPPGINGQIAQKTDEINGDIILRDFFMYWLVRYQVSMEKLARLTLEAFGDQYELPEIKKWLRIFVTKFFDNQFKRDMVPGGPKIGLVALSPRGDWRMPADAKARVWLTAIDRIPDDL